MFLAFDLDGFIKGLGLASGFLLLLAALVSIVRYYWKREDKTDGKSLLQEWQERAAVRAEKIDDLEASLRTVKQENSELTAANVLLRREVENCERRRNEEAQQVLRLNARLQSYERCINKLEERLGMQPTNFDEPFLHANPGH